MRYTVIDILNETEIIVVSNGCTDGTREYVEANSFLKLIRWNEALGYAKAINLGVLVSKGEYLILLNNDCQFLGTTWLSLLLEPFERFKNVAATGPVSLTRSGIPWLVFFCVMIKREIFTTIGYLDETYGWGGGEDTDFCIKAYMEGYTIHRVPLFKGPLGDQIAYPVYHPGGQTCGLIPGILETARRNEEKLTQLYGAGGQP